MNKGKHLPPKDVCFFRKNLTHPSITFATVFGLKKSPFSAKIYFRRQNLGNSEHTNKEYEINFGCVNHQSVVVPHARRSSLLTRVSSVLVLHVWPGILYRYYILYWLLFDIVSYYTILYFFRLSRAFLCFMFVLCWPGTYMYMYVCIYRIGISTKQTTEL